MARIVICDRCNKPLGAFHRAINRHHIHISRETDIASVIKDDIDLCDDCYELFEDYLADFIDYNHSDKEVMEWCNG